MIGRTGIAILRPYFLGRTQRWSSSKAVFDKIAFLGVGKMAQALLHPVVVSGLQPASQIAVFDVSTEVCAAVQEQHNGIVVAATPNEAVQDADLVVCAVKPQNLSDGFFAELDLASSNKASTLLSVMAGTPTQVFLDGGFTKVARSMPNTPAQIGQGMTVWTCTDNIEQDERDKIQTILGSFGEEVR